MASQANRVGWIEAVPVLLRHRLPDPTAAQHPRAGREGYLLFLRGQHITWTNAEGKETAREPLRQGWSALDRPGLWQTDGGDAGTAALLSPRETTLPVGATASADGATHRRWLNGDLSLPLLWLVLAVFLVESWLFHRHSVH